MCNDCLSTTCIDLYVSPCDEGIDIGIPAPETGDYTIYLDFNGASKVLAIQGTEGDNFILPNVMIAPAIYSIKIYNDTSELVNDTCYKAHTKLALGVGNNLNPNPSVGAKKIIVVDVDGDSFTNSFFGLHNIIEIVTSNQAYLIDVDFTQSGSTITWINGNLFYNGQTILAQS
jgi:hypothetical protein